jgi:UDP-N-acetylmuramate: L-alanyl-gamma-D-glutamyl-meso-diaminopimelate ligase
MRIHFISVGGSAMHNLAIALHLNGNKISGSDDGIFEPSLSRLISFGLMPPSIGWFPEKITDEIDIVILGMHANADNPELLEAQKRNIPVYSFPAYLYEYSKNKLRVVVSGSHGKTTITAMIVHVLKYAGIDSDFLVGDKIDGFDVMVKLSSDTKYMILEGDEYLTSPIDLKPKFFHYQPHIAVISGIAWDHLEAFPTFENYASQFSLFIRKFNPEGRLFYCEDDPVLKRIIEDDGVNATGYGVHPHEIIDGITHLIIDNEKRYPLQIFGKHNLANLNAAFLVCKELDVEETVFYKAISTFKGVSRRMELIASRDNSFIYRDFAHAPSKVRATSSALRQQYPDHNLILCYELRTFSSLSDSFIDQYSGSLDCGDLAVIFYDPKIVHHKGLPLMSHERILEGFFNDTIQIFSDRDEMIDFLKTKTVEPFVLALMTPINFDGLNWNEIGSLLFV